MKFASTPAYSIGAKTISEPKTTNKMTPGPGTYAVRKEEVEVPAPYIGTGLRPELYPKNMYPGPGTYSVPSFLDSKKLSKSDKKRDKAEKTSSGRDKTDKTKMDAPGPGSYNPQKLTRSYSYTMGNKIFSINSEKPQELGPGQYNPNYKAIHTQYMNKFGVGKRPDMFTSKGVPGPGQYNPADKTDGPQFGFGTEPKARRLLSSETPAPWAYDIPGIAEELKNKPGKTLAPKRPFTIKDSGAPGPGAYQPRLSDTAPSFSVGTGARSSFTNVKKSPGPGEYDPQNPALIEKFSKVGTGKRPPLSVPTHTPGPGAYQVESTIGGPKFGMSGRRTDLKTTEQVPGPGAYDPTINYVVKDSTHIGIGTGQRSNSSRNRPNNVPGPGNYNFYNKKVQGPYWSFGKDPRNKETFDDDPGPGQYEIPSTIADVPKYLMAVPGASNSSFKS
mmetsp:Transcript_192/g.173  ORF Transcript_192/g.173 Transcript_192/m.173 type:complete len:444 (-) Transcript_192:33-1364(-)